MDNYDIKKAHPGLYSPSAIHFALVDVPPMTFVTVNGQGDPNTAPAYIEAVHVRRD